tara:strand:- start:929 stop:1405 length:477 start_codon:yes stop_codon:yes gene_type:complete
MLCLQCNRERLHGSKYGKPIKHTQKKIKSKSASIWSLKVSDKKEKLVHTIFGGRRAGKTWGNFELDEIFYEKCFNSSNHKCEECNEKLPEEFRDSNGKIIYRARYSHIIAKSIAPELRHTLKNINHLCFLCHQKWDFGEKSKMKIYKKNQKNFAKYLK